MSSKLRIQLCTQPRFPGPNGRIKRKPLRDLRARALTKRLALQKDEEEVPLPVVSEVYQADADEQDLDIDTLMMLQDLAASPIRFPEASVLNPRVCDSALACSSSPSGNIDCSPQDTSLAAPVATQSPHLPGIDTITAIEIAAVLEDLGIYDHLRFALQRQESHMKTIVNRFAALLEWIIDTQEPYRACTVDTLQVHIKRFITQDYDIFAAYVLYLSQHKHFQPATVVAHIDDIRISCSWFGLFRSKTVNDISRVYPHEMLGFNASIKHLRKILNKKVS